MSVLLSSTLANESTSYYALAGAGSGGVSQIVAGDASIVVSPSGGTGVVTLTAPASGFLSGMIMMWNTLSPPPGWALCDGTNGTPDLRNRFPYGATGVPIGTLGGNSQVTLSLNNLPDHIHGGIPTQSAGVTEGSGGGYAITGTNQSTTGISSPGYTGASPFSVIPYYAVVSFIMKL